MKIEKHYILDLLECFKSPDIFNNHILLPTVRQNDNGVYIKMTDEEREQYRQEHIRELEKRWVDFQESLFDVGRKWFVTYKNSVPVIEEVELKDCKETSNHPWSAYTMYDRETGLYKGDFIFYRKDRLFDTKEEAQAFIRDQVVKQIDSLREEINMKQEKLKLLENVLAELDGNP